MNDLKFNIDKYGFKFKKNLGQNFIADTNLLRAIVADSGADKETTVIEIGAGAGTLTKEIAAVAKKVLAYEIDKSLKPIIEDTLQGVNNVRVFFCDILKADIKDVEKAAEGKYMVIANLPYYITTPIITHFIEKSQNCTSLTVMVQKEVAERLCAKPGSSEYGSITVLADFYGGAKIMRTVPNALFFPRPQVDSAVVRIDINKNIITVNDRELFHKVYRCAFGMRRKTLANNISKTFQTDKSRIENIIEACGFSKDIRGERLSAKDFALLSDRLSKIL
jgi:16S rRNA (adenine1518-N6/adenine1519-N6)-dimethyltransferase